MPARPAISGFADPVHEAQAHFRSVMTALSRPGTVEAFATGLKPPAPLTPELAAFALSLADHETALWLDPVLAASEEVAAFLRFHTSARLTAEATEAAFALISKGEPLPNFESFALGTDSYPDRSTTVIMAVTSIEAGQGLVLEGPGIAGQTRLALAPLPPHFAARIADNNTLFPRGIDLVFVAPGKVVALPRTTRIIGEA